MQNSKFKMERKIEITINYVLGETVRGFAKPVLRVVRTVKDDGNIVYKDDSDIGTYDKFGDPITMIEKGLFHHSYGANDCRTERHATLRVAEDITNNTATVTAPALRQDEIDRQVERALKLPRKNRSGKRGYLTQKEVCAMLGIGRTTFEWYRDSGLIPVYSVEGKVRKYAKRSEILQFLREGRFQPTLFGD
jgi:hypothetical protein